MRIAVTRRVLLHTASPMQKTTPPLASRYLFKLIANLASVPVYLIMEALLPRALGPAMYGNYSFATTVFLQMTGFLDMGTSTCFYNALSRRQQEFSLIAFYLRVSLLIMAVTMLVACGLLYEPVGSLFLPQVPLWLAPLAAFCAFLTWFGRVLRSMNDATGATIQSELWRTAVSLICVGLLVVLFLSGLLNIITLFLQQYLMLTATAVGFWYVTWRTCRVHGISQSFRLAPIQLRAYLREFFTYSHPLFVQSLLSILMLSLERWLLQWFNGSSEQGYFALSQKVSMACFLFVSAMTPLIMRELSIAWGSRDTDSMGRLINRFAPLLYIIAAYFSCFTLVEAKALVGLFGGSAFVEAIVPVQIMALYPLHQAYGQLASSVFHATGRTRVLRNMTALECLYGFLLTWLLLAPSDLWGLGQGATGLAIKTVAVQFITVNCYLWLASRFIPLHFWRNLAHQILSLSILLTIAFAAREVTLIFPHGESFTLLRFLASGLLYSLMTLLLCLGFPQLMGMQRQDLKNILGRFLQTRHS